MNLFFLLISSVTLFLVVVAVIEITLGKRSIRFLKDISPEHDFKGDKVSIVIPARNEEKEIEVALKSVLAQGYNDFEVIAIDDRSTDQTAEILEGIAKRNRKLQVHHISMLPGGWLGKNHALGVSVIALTMDDMPVTTEFAPFGTGQFFGFSDLAIGLTYSQKMTDKFSFGVTVRYMEETLDKLKMRGVMIDLGTYYWTGLGSTRFAVTVSHFGAEMAPDGKINLVGNREKSDWQSFSPPTMFRIGFAFEPYENKEHKVTTSIQLNHPNDNSENFALAVEYVWKSLLSLRGGYKFNVDEQNISFGAGVDVPISIAKFTFDYSFVNFERLGSVHRLSIILGF
ncbi:glycosyltransferase family 2 protein [candidate division KSB1 bacterium]|nr:glycosyltransferase family 2 protein [candidate division KSB1 bacterium]